MSNGVDRLKADGNGHAPLKKGQVGATVKAIKAYKLRDSTTPWNRNKKVKK